MRYASDVADPAKRASSLIDSLPGNSVVSKTMIVTLGTGATAWALSNEIFIINAEYVAALLQLSLALLEPG